MGRIGKLSEESPESDDSSDGRLMIVDLKIKDEPDEDEGYGVLNETSNDVAAVASDLEIKQEKDDDIVTESRPEDSQNVKRRKRSVVTIPIRQTTRRSAGVAQQTLCPAKNHVAGSSKKHSGGKSLSIEELSRLSEKQLVPLFSEMSSNEFTKNFAYACCLMPGKCNAFFTSFGNETRAKNKMKEHLIQHVKELVEKKKKDKSFTFSSQTVLPPDEGISIKKRGKYKDSKFQNSSSETGGNNSHSESLNTSGADLHQSADETTTPADSSENVLETINLQGIKIEKVDIEDSEILKELSVQSVNNVVPEDESESAEIPSRRKRKTGDDSDWTSKLQAVKKVRKSRVAILSSSPAPPVIKPVSAIAVTEPVKHECNSGHPLCTDHVYDMRHRKRKTVDSNGKESSDGNDKVLSTGGAVSCLRTDGFKCGSDVLEGNFLGHLSVRLSLLPDEDACPMKLLIPIVKVPRYSLPDDLSTLPNNPFEMCNLKDDSIEIILPTRDMKGDRSGNGDDNNGSAGSAEDYEEVISETEAREIERKNDTYDEAETKALALFYLKELKMKKGPMELVCKICIKKRFTATATLIYHYKSHAGIKPFTCKRCGVHFTRQHSLNYHLLIHQNINRFTCNFCNRQFRHPSHYKEHLRKHTGETPFSCPDCEMKFKTRNTFKRHMKTRHNKEVPVKKAIRLPKTTDQPIPIAPAPRRFVPLIANKLERKNVLTSVINSSNGFSSIYPLTGFGQQRHSNSLLSRSLIRTNLCVTAPLVVKVKQEPNDVQRQEVAPTPICIAPIETSPASCPPASRSVSLLAQRPNATVRRTPSILLNRNKPKILTKQSPVPPSKLKINGKPVVAKIPNAALLPRLEVINLKQ